MVMMGAALIIAGGVLWCLQRRIHHPQFWDIVSALTGVAGVILAGAGLFISVSGKSDIPDIDNHVPRSPEIASDNSNSARIRLPHSTQPPYAGVTSLAEND